MKKTLLPMRQPRISKEAFELADAFLPLIQRMLSDPTVVFARPDVLAEHRPISECSSQGIQKHDWGTRFEGKEV